jgi:hypothetical protein
MPKRKFNNKPKNTKNKVSCQNDEDEEADKLNMSNEDNQSDNSMSTDNSTASGSNENGGALKETISQAMMNSNLLNSLPKYIFQSEHSRLKSVTSILKEVKEQQSRDAALQSTTSECEVSEYPIEFYENQQHAIERHMSIK